MRRAPRVSLSKRFTRPSPARPAAARSAFARVEPLEGRQLLSAELISVTSGGVSGDGDSGEASVSQNGRYVAFTSTSTNLVAGDTNGTSDVFLRDRSNNTTILVSKSAAGAPGDEASFEPKVSNDGNFVVFVSRASNLVAGDKPEAAGGNADVFRFNIQTGAIELVSQTTEGGFPDGDSGEPNVSANGQFIAYSTRARGLGGPDNNNAADVFVRDMNRGAGDSRATRAVSVAAGGNENETMADGRSFDPQVSDDGNFVSFRSAATNLNGGDTNGFVDNYVRDMTAGTNVLVSVSTAGASGNAESQSNSISGDGKFVAFRSAASDLVPNDTNNAEDIFLRNLTNNTTTLLSVNRTGTASARGQSRFPWLSANAGAVTFSSSATDLVADDNNNQEDVFLRDLVNGPIYLLSTNAAGTGGNGASYDTYTSRDGAYVTFTSEASDLAAGDNNSRTDVFFANTPIPPAPVDPTDPTDPNPPPPPPPNPNPPATPDTTAPTASLPATQPGATPGSSEYLFNVNLADDRALNTIAVGNLEVVRNGATLPATFVNVIGSGTAAQATYRVTFPTPLSAADNGTISVRLPAGAVKDAAGNAAAAATLGDIAVNVGDPNGPNLTATITPKIPAGTVILGGKKSKGSAKVNVTNTGQAAITKQPVVVSLFLSDNPTLDASDTQIGTQTKALTLKQGKGKALSFKFTFPATVGNGAYFLIGSADANNAILEANEGDNVAVSGAPVNLAQPFLDLRATVGRPSGATTPGGAGLVTVNVINDGNVQLTRPVTIRLAASTDASADPADPVITTFTKRLSVKPGATKATPVKFNYPAGLAAGTYFVTATIDPLGEIAETSKSNNTAASESVAIA
ncbi:MAG: hypothetical protein AVDCRST_MAG64-3842 [uncultured Phycisphaerae bacterium]|uniref:Uncharacterized protein n=1 Tax=uncultured Phycisphaerae bacterium TaxID=904963 RepID=A0A6J4QG76_9BACT|nr:MAG: hypothetical protein AVDCRST_MAG64-3842 [uncultured Phycisphaerae bacterium]